MVAGPGRGGWLAVEAWRRTWFSAVRVWLPATAAVTTVLAHAGYYVLRVGGDHFEYRVFCPLIPLGALAMAAMAARIRGSHLAATCVALLPLGSSVTWVHFALTDAKPPPDYDPLAEHVPASLQPLARWYDRRRLWLQMHFVCGRVPRVDTSLATTLANMPERRRQPIDQDDYPVAAMTAIGVTGWVLADYAVIDQLGLCDWVAARAPLSNWAAQQLPREFLVAALDGADGDGDTLLSRAELERMIGAWPGSTAKSASVMAGVFLVLFAEQDPASITRLEAGRIPTFFAELRLMAHERLAPAEYLQALDPNVTIEGTRIVTRKRAKPLDADAIRAIERQWRERLKR